MFNFYMYNHNVFPTGKCGQSFPTVIILFPNCYYVFILIYAIGNKSFIHSLTKDY